MHTAKELKFGFGIPYVLQTDLLGGLTTRLPAREKDAKNPTKHTEIPRFREGSKIPISWIFPWRQTRRNFIKGSTCSTFKSDPKNPQIFHYSQHHLRKSRMKPPCTNQVSFLYETNPNNSLLREIIQMDSNGTLRLHCSPLKWVPCNDPCQHPPSAFRKKMSVHCIKGYNICASAAFAR